MVSAPEITSAPPLAASIAASVAMKGGMRSTMMLKAFSAPKAMPARMAAGSATSMPRGERYAAMTEVKAATEPTERSMPPVMMTKHMPTEMMMNIEL